MVCQVFGSFGGKGPLEITSTMGEGGMNVGGCLWLGTPNYVSNKIQIVNGQIVCKENIFFGVTTGVLLPDIEEWARRTFTG